MDKLISVSVLVLREDETIASNHNQPRDHSIFQLHLFGMLCEMRLIHFMTTYYNRLLQSLTSILPITPAVTIVEEIATSTMPSHGLDDLQ